MRFLLALSALTLALAGCDNDSAIRISSRSTDETGEKGVLRVVQTLQCPASEGVLTRKGAPAVDGLSCTYSGPRGSEVVLRLVALDGREISSVLTDFENQLQADLPGAMGRIAAMAAPEPAADPDGGEDVDIAAPGVAVRARGDNAVVRLPGIRIQAEGENARVRIGGLNIVADDSNQSVKIQTDDDALSVRSQDDAAEIRTTGQGGGVRSTYVLVDEAAEAGAWRMVGFEARGPSTGPLVIATVRSKHRREDDLFDAAKALVTANVGE